MKTTVELVGEAVSSNTTWRAVLAEYLVPQIHELQKCLTYD